MIILLSVHYIFYCAPNVTTTCKCHKLRSFPIFQVNFLDKNSTAYTKKYDIYFFRYLILTMFSVFAETKVRISPNESSYYFLIISLSSFVISCSQDTIRDLKFSCESGSLLISPFPRLRGIKRRFGKLITES